MLSKARVIALRTQRVAISAVNRRRNPFLLQLSNFSTNPNGDDFAASAVTDLATKIDSTAMEAAAAVAAIPDPPGMVSGAVMTAIDHIHLFAGVPYWEAIVIGTVGLRFILFPVVLKTLQSSGRMALMRPEMEKVRIRMDSDPQIDDMRVKMKYQMEMKALFAKYQVNPFRAMLWPVCQIPIFISLYLGLSQMGIHYPDFATGGDFFFTNLSIPDATMALPILNAVSFLYMIELGSDGFQTQQGNFKMIMRGLAVAMVPLTMDLPTGVFVYWTANNIFSIAQTHILKIEGIRNFFNLPRAPPAAPNSSSGLSFVSMQKAAESIKNELRSDVNAKPEILDGSNTTPVSDTPSKPPPVTFSAPPKKPNETKK